MAGKSKYRKEYCNRIIAHMAEGLSIEAFAGVVGVHKDTLYQWVKKYSDFEEAKKVGEMKSLLFWEKMGRSGAAGKLPGFNCGTWIFNMKNRFGWRDKKEVEIGDKTRDTLRLAYSLEKNE